MNGEAVEVPAAVQNAFDQASDIMSRAFPIDDLDAANPPITDLETATNLADRVREAVPVDLTLRVDHLLSAFALGDLPDEACAKLFAQQSAAFIIDATARVEAEIAKGPKSKMLSEELTLDLAALRAAAAARGDVLPAADPSRILEIALDDIAPDPAQARDEGADDSIGDTLKPTDILPAIELRVNPNLGQRIGPAILENLETDNRPYMIIDGERRWRGSKKAGRATIRAWVNPNPGDDGDRLLRQAVLNEGERLKPMEEARTWARIRAAKGWNIQQLAEAVKRPKSTVSDRLAMLNAPAMFQPLFAKGVLPAAAAPIIRKFKDVPEHILKAHVEQLVEDDWHDFVATQTPIPLSDVEQSLGGVKYRGALRRIYGEDVGKLYTGPTCTIGDEKFATDVEAFEAARRASYMPSESSADRKPSKAEQDAGAREAAERRKQQLKLQTRRAQFDAISAKLPTSIGGSANGADWSQLLVDLVMQEVHQDTLRVLAAQLKLTGEKSRTGGMSHYGDMVKRHAKTLSSQGRVKLAMQLLLAPDINIPAYIARGPERFAAAAKLAKLDLSKIKAPGSGKPEGKSKAVKKSAPKSAAKKPSPNAVFMAPRQPDLILGAIVGDKPLTRVDITKKLWQYIKKHGLQDAKERRMINGDAKLRPLFDGKAKVSMFEMTKLVNQHLKPVKA